MRKAGIKTRYRRAIREHGETVLFRRYTGSGTNRPIFNAEIRAMVTGYQPQELIGGIVFGERRVIILAEDVFKAQIGTITASDKIVVRGRECAIGGVDDSTHRDGADLVAYEMKVSG